MGLGEEPGPKRVYVSFSVKSFYEKTFMKKNLLILLRHGQKFYEKNFYEKPFNLVKALTKNKYIGNPPQWLHPLQLLPSSPPSSPEVQPSTAGPAPSFSYCLPATRSLLAVISARRSHLQAHEKQLYFKGKKGKNLFKKPISTANGLAPSQDRVES